MKKSLTFSLLLALGGACGDDDGGGVTPDPDMGTGVDMAMTDEGVTPETGTPETGTPDGGMADPLVYAFESRFEAGESSIAYSGQTTRHTLLDDLTSEVINLARSIEEGRPGFDTEESIREELQFFMDYSRDADGDTPLLLTGNLPIQQSTYGEIGNGALTVKIAGEDGRDHEDFGNPDSGAFIGWNGATGYENTPLGYTTWMLDELARLGGIEADPEAPARLGPNGETLPPTITENGLDLRQLLQKFLLGAIMFSQGADDYMDEGFDDNLAINGDPREGAPYSEIEHAWDEAFGYYGAPRNAHLYSDEEAASKGGREDWQGEHDTDANGSIDLASEYFFGAAVNAAKRDLDQTSGTVNLSEEVYNAFTEGRAILASGTTDAGALARLEVVRQQAILGWERVIAATAIHYVNVTLSDMENLGTDDYNLLEHAKHWGELKGFAFSFQFNPRSPITTGQFTELHAVIGDAPFIDGADTTGAEAARAALIRARDIMAAAYGFGDDDVENW
ncbi:MAG: DUF4856 domain-containing protein [Myxococcota bacterium]